MSLGPLFDPSILFFVVGIAAGLMRSSLEIPVPIARFLSLYLLMALGLKGGFALAASGITVTFITATQYLEKQGIEYGGHMAAAMALMESPAIIFAVLMANMIRSKAVAGNAPSGVPHTKMSSVLRESFTEGAQILLLGSMLIGLITGDSGKAIMEPFTGQLFKGMLAFFLLDMGIATASRMADLRGVPKRLILYGVFAPPVHACIALMLCVVFQIPEGNAALLAVLAASASYIAVPAVLKHAIPEASPVFYLGLSLGLTFPINIIIGIPIYAGLAQWLLS